MALSVESPLVEESARTSTRLAYPPELAAPRIGIGRTTLFALIKGGEIHALKIGRRTVITEAELQRFLAVKMAEVRRVEAAL